MNGKQLRAITFLLVSALMLTGACSKLEGNKGEPAENPPTEDVRESIHPEETPEAVSESVKPQQKEGNKEIVIGVDQEPQEGSSGNMFYFFVENLPPKYYLKELRWKSKTSDIVDTWEDAINNGAGLGNDDYGFYISGNGQFSGFIYEDSMKEEKGEFSIVFRDEQQNEVIWKKSLTLR
ncbi:hypothetical protein I6N90_10795 [Paenibacillus sp. GSMTC-2017]|uniref:hypothetical protein n=1 Tax=Paenibacillus sp. GSMTC-2017 TaxID=2794350 RepID=UPI0018D8D798|nr:hypothetical protein [Paenibacillus sp. GSMTC-2017]MBH5318297.1 hypothetical protein [Paenibacillus sp. GSMTC-2017]